MIIRDLDLLRIYPNNIEHCVFRIFDFMDRRCWFEFSNILIEANVSFPLKNIGKSSSISYDRIWMIKEPVGCLGFLPPSAVIYYHGQFGKLFITDMGYECLTRYMKDWYLRLVTNSSLLHINILKSTLLAQHSALSTSILNMVSLAMRTFLTGDHCDVGHPDSSGDVTSVVAVRPHHHCPHL